MKTQRGIYLNIEESDISFTDEDVTYYFSSEFNKKRFIENYKEYHEEENQKLINKYKLKFNFKQLFDLIYYMKIEKRGFRVIYNDEPITENDIIFVSFTI